MGGKGSSSAPPRPQGQPATGNSGPQRSQGPQRQQQQRPPGRTPQPNRMPQQPQSRPRDMGLRIGEEAIVNLYSPRQKPSPMTPLPARVGVRQERRPYNPELAISAAEERQLQKNIDFERGYGPSFAIDPTLLGSDNEEDALGESGSFIGDPSRW